MPADVAVHPNFLSFPRSPVLAKHPQQQQSGPVDTCWNTENASGRMKLLSSDAGARACQVNVYRTSVEHFAVIYPEGSEARPLGVLNLRNTSIERLGQDGFTVRQRGCDSPQALSFVLHESKDIDYWILAFTPRSSPLAHHSCLPIVQEEDV